MLQQALLVSFVLYQAGAIDYELWEPVFHVEVDKDEHEDEPFKMHAVEFVGDNQEDIEKEMEAHDLGDKSIPYNRRLTIIFENSIQK